MTAGARQSSRTRMAVLQWAARMGAVTARDVAVRQGTSLASARATLAFAERDGLIARHRPLAGQPSLYAATRLGIRAAGERELDPCRVSASNALHLITCGRVAAVLERRYADHRVLGERELRRAERQRGVSLASARLDYGCAGAGLLHRPDLVLWPRDAGAVPTAVEVELTVKAPRRLAGICRAWARCRCVAGVVYVFAPTVEDALRRAIDAADAGERIVAIPLCALETAPSGR